MRKILHIRSSIKEENSVSRKIGDDLISHFKSTDKVKVSERDLVDNSVEHINPDFINAMANNNQDRLATSNKLIEELFENDIIAIESPMYNFSIPSTLKSWIDNIMIARKTFLYTANGPEGLVKNKKAILVLSKGNIYSEGAAKPLDFQENYLKTILNFIGINDITVICAEGVDLNAEIREKSLKQVEQQIKNLSI
ncbi:NAD(P)H-dependent oxidoreductase [Francisella philomiragia]|uniref:FMN-dependent NADH:quinone oxidoreductase n=1 Tax=Francisella philomiragia subsp. philomiragia (strain ATCC 25017 / CCUG 19701 / FSC 153 / O\|nr:NAD(P)H-dependent oxidoreductase [Francisella philomiragia]B0TWJ9.1 RecName: Full=FMN-dependent NADH:quinone oxidoreductase; AltName: Full=Azo-dye reductase; AltName: Full=FMN-dependent NADH-azo compound oxidoreductase; AltName: Full=FMN-dependent NADH-azoreductase [Francisella philomiragia subsp. philomiragia ATCC 25017]AJI47842.1 NADPH-dependent FMN reductase family protein [Francisella philomiragia]AJI49088.1 NADPH-dependent FMN reductase family protein [Francisella philomiragia]MBK202084